MKRWARYSPLEGPVSSEGEWLYNIYLSMPLSSVLILAVISDTVCRYGLRTKSQVSFRDGRGRESTGNPSRTDTTTTQERGGGGGGGGRGRERREGGWVGWERETP